MEERADRDNRPSPDALLRQIGQGSRGRFKLQTIRAGFVASKAEWQNRAASVGGDAPASALAHATIAHFVAQIAAVDQAIAQTIDDDDELRGKRDLLLSIDGVGETLAAVILAELPDRAVITSSAQAVAYAGLNPRRLQSGSSNQLPDAHLQDRQRNITRRAVHAGNGGDAPQQGGCRLGGTAARARTVEAQADRRRRHAQVAGNLLRRPQDRQTVRRRSRHAGMTGQTDIPWFDREPTIPSSRPGTASASRAGVLKDGRRPPRSGAQRP